MSQAEVVETTPKSKKKLFVLVGALAVVITAAAAWFLLLAPQDAEAAEPVDGEIVTFEPLTTTLGVSSPSHARVSLAIVLSEGTDPALIEPKQALLQDALLQEIAAMQADQLRSAEGSDQLRQALTADARAIWGDDVVRRVVLTELLVQ
ncbi:flagellar basal body-associated FliL family protein [Egicoccus halophilus]|uniref:Flagellar protein FliL n=1 Tax=Egicoccus halophilus TaxID=1670830 RepID=A0A8J3A8L3_9ACTN|nr:flagellar basal body-associated FliL family protein [Egicoccus halophilus]GGI06715.1 hypothetical protein GCM10011354_20480 [Egicoccus halophilus]